jgi:hypothetical protein
MTAWIIMQKMAIQAQMSRHVMTQPTIFIGLLFNALPIWKVAEVRAVLGKM